MGKLQSTTKGFDKSGSNTLYLDNPTYTRLQGIVRNSAGDMVFDESPFNMENKVCGTECMMRLADYWHRVADSDKRLRKFLTEDVDHIVTEIQASINKTDAALSKALAVDETNARRITKNINAKDFAKNNTAVNVNLKAIKTSAVASPALGVFPGVTGPIVTEPLITISAEDLQEAAQYLIEGYIPENWSNQKLLIVLYLLSQTTGVGAIASISHYLKNRISIADVYTPGEYIENQWQWTDVSYGLNPPGDAGTMAYSGCELIAIVNAMHSLGYDMSVDEVAELIRQYEGRGATLGGIWGTSPTVIYENLCSQGYDIQLCQSTDYSEIKKIAESSDTLIVTVYNDKNDLTQMIHTVNIEIVTHTDGSYGYIVHNSGLENKEFSDIEDAIKHIGSDSGNSENIQVMGISNP
ncbi:hypothetical protein D6853_07005 [Butyrivibrio sp. X503]|uniref:hypothetical protein n=1 Tax=Butyrivibrio sp. X503 TaxID=2364878 RepID=UPI000EA8417E|nr:hypothetical protein [Butyrivibrio sp. X503]RKM56529.1 hypothetical protein D6853_07005 [Butyrivibrio sp. X503]